jgi:RHS repeat-associated protein
MTRRDVTGGSMTYKYDANGTMVKRTNVDGTSTVYIGGIFEKTFNPAGIATGTTKYYSALGRTLAMRTETGGAPTLTYLLADHLGTTVGSIDATTGTVSTQKYWPYGATRSGAIAQTDKLYTGQQQELGDALGLYNYKARFYSTVTGRFVSADPKTSDGLNRYAYARNNPLRYNDPSGHCVGGPKAPCNPQIALNLLACAQSVEGCAIVFEALGRDSSLKDIAAAHDFASAAVGTPQFWGNFSRADINPYFNGDALLGAYRAGFDPISGLFPYANLAFERYFPSNGSQLLDAAVDWLTDPQQLTTAILAGSGATMRYACTEGMKQACVAAITVWVGAFLANANHWTNEAKTGNEDVLLAWTNVLIPALTLVPPSSGLYESVVRFLAVLAAKQTAGRVHDVCCAGD